jgi:acylphosphatase
VRVRRDDVPEQDLVLDAELREDAPDDRRGRLGRTRPGQLPLRGERNAAHAGTEVAGGLADEEDACTATAFEVVGQPVAAKARPRAVPVEVEGRADSSLGQEAHEAGRAHPRHGRSLRTVRRRVVVYGRVQGVFFRDSLRRRAEKEGVAGWARNTSDGTVEAVFEGEQVSVERLIAFARQGPPHARVDDVRIFEEEAESLSGFSIR